jgi:hypothetical protein
MHLLEETMENFKNQGLINAGKRSLFSLKKKKEFDIKVMDRQCFE